MKLAEKLHKELFEEASGTAVHSLSLSWSLGDRARLPACWLSDSANDASRYFCSSFAGCVFILIPYAPPSPVDKIGLSPNSAAIHTREIIKSSRQLQHSSRVFCMYVESPSMLKRRCQSAWYASAVRAPLGSRDLKAYMASRFSWYQRILATVLTNIPFDRQFVSHIFLWTLGKEARCICFIQDSERM